MIRTIVLNKVNVAIRQAKELFYKKKFSKSDGDPRKTWQVINELTSRKTGRSSVRELSLNQCFNNEFDRFVKRFQ